MKLPTVGELRHRLRLESAMSSGDGGGGSDVIWTPVAELWACVRAVSGSERLTAEALAGRGMHEVWVRYRADVAPALRFVAGSRVLDIRAALDPDGRKRWLRCVCEERLQ